MDSKMVVIIYIVKLINIHSFIIVKRMQFIYHKYEYMIYALVLIGFVFSVGIWISIVRNTPIPEGSIYDTASTQGSCKMMRNDNAKDLEKFYFFPKIGVLNTAPTLRNSLDALSIFKHYPIVWTKVRFITFGIFFNNMFSRFTYFSKY